MVPKILVHGCALSSERPRLEELARLREIDGLEGKKPVKNPKFADPNFAVDRCSAAVLARLLPLTAKS